MKQFPILYWPRNTKGDNDYQLSRRIINNVTGVMPDVVTDEYDLTDVLSQNANAVIYYPVFCGSTGWWGELLGADSIITDKVIVSPECQLMVIQSQSAAPRSKSGQQQLLVAEIYPSSGFFKKMNAGIATVADMLATDTGTILALFSGKNRSQFINVLESTGNSYLGCIGRY